jgi:exodeoxyribonuclease VII small subunit
MENFEEKLKRLENLSEEIKDRNISIEDAIKNFEEGIKLAKELENEIEGIENKIQILMKEPLETNTSEENKLEKSKSKKKNLDDCLELFNTDTVISGTRKV